MVDNEKKTLFEKDCKIINLSYEYPNLVGNEKWAIISDLSMQELTLKYNTLLTEYTPFVLLSTEHADIFKKFDSNNRKHRKRQTEKGDAFGFESKKNEMFNYSNICIDMETNILNSIFIDEVFSILSDTQRKRLIKNFFMGYSLRDIAKEEGVNYAAVASSVSIAKEKIKDFLK